MPKLHDLRVGVRGPAFTSKVHTKSRQHALSNSQYVLKSGLGPKKNSSLDVIRAKSGVQIQLSA